MDIGRRLSRAWSCGEYIEIYVNPDDPADSVIDVSFPYATGEASPNLSKYNMRMEAGYVKTVRRLLGVPVRKRKIQRNYLIRFSSRSSSQTRAGSKHVMYYTIHAEDNRGQEIVVGEGLTGAGEASAAIRMLAH